MNGYVNLIIGDIDVDIYEDGVVGIIDEDNDVAVFNKQDAINLARAILNHFKEETE